jgi:hypothetical protein
MIPSTVKNINDIYKKWLKESYAILPNLTSKDLQKFGLDVVNGLFFNTLVINLFDIRTQIRDKCKQLGIENKIPDLPQSTKVITKQKVAK